MKDLSKKVAIFLIILCLLKIVFGAVELASGYVRNIVDDNLDCYGKN